MTTTMQAPTFRQTAFDFFPPAPWTWPSCETVTITRDAGPRCAVCGFRESED